MSWGKILNRKYFSVKVKFLKLINSIQIVQIMKIKIIIIMKKIINNNLS